MRQNTNTTKGSGFAPGPFLLKAFGIFLLASVALIGVVGLVIPRVIGWYPYTIVSASMEPELPVGCVVYVQSEADSESGVSPGGTRENHDTGDIIAFYRGQEVVVHRVVENDIQNGDYITKGDANTETDLYPVPYSDVIGSVKLTVPFFGTVFSALDTSEGKVLLCVIAVLGLALCLRGRRSQ